MVFLFLLILICTGGIIPGWVFAKKRKPQSFLIFVMPLASIIIWFLFIIIDIGKAGVGNLIEIFFFVPFSVVVAYLKFFVFDRKLQNKYFSVAFAYIVVIAVVLSLRIFMPLLPE